MSKQNTNRLVLGERDAVLQETRKRGGVFIDPHPEVLKTLEAGSIDPYLIFEKALLQQIEARIPRVDVVRANVDQLFEQWKSTPSAQTPIHIRLILWLKKNASVYGYEQVGNSWRLSQ